MKLIHVTDPHLLWPGAPLYDLDPVDRFRKCIADIERQHADADLLVITGDLADRGEPAAYVAMRETLDKLSMPWRLVIGNHDERAAFREVFPDTPVDDDGFLQSTLDLDAGLMVFLDTIEPRTHAGWYCEKRQAWLRRTLAEAGDGWIYLFMHHPPFDIGIPVMDKLAMVQADAFEKLIAPYRDDIRHIFFGHVHRPISGSWQGIPFSTLYGTNHQVALDFAAEEIVVGSEEPPAYAVVLINDASVIVHTHSFLDVSRRFSMGGTDWEDWQKNTVVEKV